MTNEDIARLIVNAYNMGKVDGHKEGYDEAYDKGYDRGFEAGVEYGKDISKEQKIDEQLEELNDYACTCPQCTHPAEYDAGYAAGFGSTEPCLYGETKEYRAGYLDGQRDSMDGSREIEMQAEEEEDEEESDEECMSSSLAYDIGWNDGYEGADVDKEYEHDRVYMWGYKNGRGQRIAAMK